MVDDSTGLTRNGSTTQQGRVDDSTGLSRFVEFFPSLAAVPDLVHGFVLRHPEVDVKVDRDEALSRLQPHYDRVLEQLGIPKDSFWTGEQIHGDSVFEPREGPAEHTPDTDGFVTGVAGTYLGIFVADCGAVYIVDPVKRACGLIHSGKKGSELGIARRAIELMVEKFGSNPADLIVQISPCIRPPAYEIDFAEQIREDCELAGVTRVFDDQTCTSCDPDRYYSYRTEEGKTGRMLAILGFKKT